MDSNKEEAQRCINLAKEAIASGDKRRATKFIGIARRLNHSLAVDDLLAACEKLGSDAPAYGGGGKSSGGNMNGPVRDKGDGVLNGERNYTEEHVQLIREIKRNKDYYAVLGLEKGCAVEEIRKAYKKLSLKVHPDKNKAPGSEEAFKKVCKAFKCLSDNDSRRQYDQTGLVDEFEYNRQHNVRRGMRRRTTANQFFDDEFDADEIFRAFFGRQDMYQTPHVYRTRGMRAQPRENQHDAGPNLLLLLQIIPFLLVILLAYLPFSDPHYSLQKNYAYQFPKTTEKHGIKFFVKSSDFDQNFPLGSPARDNIEGDVIKDYKHMLGRYCHMELQRRQWSRNLPTPHCDKLRDFGVA